MHFHPVKVLPLSSTLLFDCSSAHCVVITGEELTAVLLISIRLTTFRVFSFMVLFNNFRGCFRTQVLSIACCYCTDAVIRYLSCTFHKHEKQSNINTVQRL